MQNVPRFLKGHFRGALRVALEDILKGARTNDAATEERVWKLFLLLPQVRDDQVNEVGGQVRDVRVG